MTLHIGDTFWRSVRQIFKMTGLYKPVAFGLKVLPWGLTGIASVSEIQGLPSPPALGSCKRRGKSVASAQRLTNT